MFGCRPIIATRPRRKIVCFKLELPYPNVTSRIVSEHLPNSSPSPEGFHSPALAGSDALDGRLPRVVRFLSFVVLTIVGVLLYLLLGGRQTTASGKTTLTFWTVNLAPTYNAYFEALIQEFEREHPTVDLVWLDFSQDASRQKLMASIAAGEPPDLVNLDTEFALTMAQNGALTRLDDYVTPEQRALYFPNLWEAGQFEGSTYALPWYVTTRVIMMNRNVMKAAGLDPNKPPKTWAELDAFARQISERTDSVGMMPAIRIVNDWSMAGDKIVDRDNMTAAFVNPGAIAAVDRYRKLYAEGVMPPETLTEGYKGALDRFKAGSLGFLDAGPQFLLRIKADAPSVYKATGLAPLPETATHTIPAATMNFAVPISSKNRELAVELGLFLTSPKAQLEFAKLVPLLPSTIASTKDPYFQQGGEDPLQAEAVRISLGQLSQCRDFSLTLPRQKDLMRSLNSAVEGAIRGDVTTEQALREAAEEWDKTLAPFRKE